MMDQHLFVPGGKRTKSDWDKVRAILASRGQRTEAITLSDPERASLGDHIAEVCRLIDQGDLKEVILVGHSYAGFVITGVADAVPGRIARLVYVDSASPSLTFLVPPASIRGNTASRPGPPSGRHSSSMRP